MPTGYDELKRQKRTSESEQSPTPSMDIFGKPVEINHSDAMVEAAAKRQSENLSQHSSQEQAKVDIRPNYVQEQKKKLTDNKKQEPDKSLNTPRETRKVSALRSQFEPKQETSLPSINSDKTSKQKIWKAAQKPSNTVLRKLEIDSTKNLPPHHETHKPLTSPQTPLPYSNDSTTNKPTQNTDTKVIDKENDINSIPKNIVSEMQKQLKGKIPFSPNGNPVKTVKHHNNNSPVSNLTSSYTKKDDVVPEGTVKRLRDQLGSKIPMVPPPLNYGKPTPPKKDIPRVEPDIATTQDNSQTKTNNPGTQTPPSEKEKFEDRHVLRALEALTEFMNNNPKLAKQYSTILVGNEVKDKSYGHHKKTFDCAITMKNGSKKAFKIELDKDKDGFLKKPVVTPISDDKEVKKIDYELRNNSNKTNFDSLEEAKDKTQELKQKYTDKKGPAPSR